jgi:hypothetical protein
MILFIATILIAFTITLAGVGLEALLSRLEK